MKQEVLIGQTDYTVLVKIRDDAGAPATGLTEASVDIAYARVETDNDVTTTDVTPAALASLTAAHADWGFEEVSATDHPGLYRLDIADAVFASGAWSAVVTVVGTGLDPADMEFVLVNHNPQSALADVLADTAEVQASLAAGGLIESMVDDLQTEVDGIQADTEDIQSRLPAALVSGRIDASVGAMAANVMTAAAAAADLTTELQNGLATAADLATVAGYLDTEIAAILADTNELQTDWADGGRLDLILDARASQTSVNTIDDLLDTEMPALTTAVADLPTNAELATALGTADDAVLAAIAALNNISVANILAGTIEGSTTLVQTLRLLNAALGGKASGLETTTAVYRDLADSKNRIEATVDADGNRSAVTLDLT